MGIQTSSLTTIGISASAPATYDVAGFGALTFTDIGEVTELGEFGRVYQVVEHQPLATRATEKRKGNYNDGALSISVAIDGSDAGQILVETALDDDSSYSFEVTFQNGDIYYFSGQVVSFPTSVTSNAMVSGTISVEVDGAIIKSIA